MIRKSKGKYVWKKKAIWCNDWSLSPVIHSYLTTLLKAVKEDENIGIPVYYCEKQAKIEGLECYDWDSEIDIEAAHQLRVKDLEEMVWAFSKDSEPDIRKLRFHLQPVDGRSGFAKVEFGVHQRRRTQPLPEGL